MIQPQEVQRLVRLLQDSDVTMFECEDSQGLLRLHFDRSAVAVSLHPAAAAASVLEETAKAPVLRSPGIGLLRLRHPLAESGFVGAGATVTKGTIVAVLQADEVLLPVEADRDGIVARFLEAEGALIGFGTPLLQWG